MKKIIMCTIIFLLGFSVAKSQTSNDQLIIGKWLFIKEVPKISIPDEFPGETTSKKDIPETKKDEKGFKTTYEFKSNIVSIKEINYNTIDEKHFYYLSDTYLTIGSNKYEIVTFTENEIVLNSNFGFGVQRLVRIED